MAVRVGINGFGRIGRIALRAVLTEPRFSHLEVVAINGLQDLSYMIYMLKYDSVHGRLNCQVEEQDGVMLINKNPVAISHEKDPSEIPWGANNVDVVIEATGVFKDQVQCAKHLQQGAKKVVISAPSKGDIPMYVYGVNHNDYNDEAIISAASCTTNALAPVVKVLHKQFGIKSGLMTTVHAATASQSVVDGESKKDWRGGRSVMGNIIPSTTGAAKAVTKVLPELEGRISGMAFRIPSANVSVVDFTCELSTDTTYEAVCSAMYLASVSSELGGVLAYTNEKLVSSDFSGIAEASIFDAGAGMMLNNNFLKAVAWYDNEYGYTCNLLRMVEHISLTHCVPQAVEVTKAVEYA